MRAITRLCRLPAVWAWLLFALFVWGVSCTPDPIVLRRAHLFIGDWDVILAEEPADVAEDVVDPDAFTLELRQIRARVELHYRGRTLAGTLASEFPGFGPTPLVVTGEVREDPWAWTEIWLVEFDGVMGLPPFGVFQPTRLRAQVFRDGVGPHGRFTTVAYALGMRPE